MPRVLIYCSIFFASLALLPLAWLYRGQATSSNDPRLHVVADMDNQAYHRGQETSRFFTDGRAMRRPVEGTVARGDLREDDVLYTGQDQDSWVTFVPGGIDSGMLARGRDRYQVFCAPCHGDTGSGDGMVARRAATLAEGTWTPPSDLTSEVTAARPEGEVFSIIGKGVRTMPPYEAQISVADRWAIVAYLRALQRSANGRLGDVPENLRSELR